MKIQFNQTRSLLASAILLITVGLSGCHTSSVVYVDPYGGAWRDVYSDPCGYRYSYGCYYYDDYYSYNGYDYYYDHGDYYYGDSGWGYYDDSGWYYPAEDRSSKSEDRDLIGQMEAIENDKAIEAGQKLAQKYALAEDSGIRIAKTLQDYATLGRKRERTSADMAEFSQRLFGVKMDEAQKALSQAEKGNIEGLQSLNEVIADHWGTTPETSKQILMDWYGKQQ